MRFRDHKYEWSKPFTHVRHQWSFRGPMGGIHYHASISDTYPPSCGLEFHRDFDPYGGERAADHAKCWLTGGKCWHDGTSLYATDDLWPMISAILKGGDHEAIFRFLEQEYEDHFAKFQGYRRAPQETPHDH